jgi:hypothetical protein
VIRDSYHSLLAMKSSPAASHAAISPALQSFHCVFACAFPTPAE